MGVQFGPGKWQLLAEKERQKGLTERHETTGDKLLVALGTEVFDLGKTLGVEYAKWKWGGEEEAEVTGVKADAYAKSLADASALDVSKLGLEREKFESEKLTGTGYQPGMVWDKDLNGPGEGGYRALTSDEQLAEVVAARPRRGASAATVAAQQEKTARARIEANLKRITAAIGDIEDPADPRLPGLRAELKMAKSAAAHHMSKYEVMGAKGEAVLKAKKKGKPPTTQELMHASGYTMAEYKLVTKNPVMYDRETGSLELMAVELSADAGFGEHNAEAGYPTIMWKGGLKNKEKFLAAIAQSSLAQRQGFLSDIIREAAPPIDNPDAKYMLDWLLMSSTGG